MVDLGSLAESDSRWSLEEFVEVANHYLEQVLSQLNQEDAKKRFREPVTARLVRYYASQSLIDKPEKVGREVRYSYRHLLQILVCRCLFIQGQTIQAIQEITLAFSNDELDKILKNVSQKSGVSAGSVVGLGLLGAAGLITPLAFLGGGALAVGGLAAGASLIQARRKTNFSDATEFELKPGLTLKIDKDFDYPKTQEDYQKLINQINPLIIAILNPDQDLE